MAFVQNNISVIKLCQVKFLNVVFCQTYRIRKILLIVQITVKFSIENAAPGAGAGATLKLDLLQHRDFVNTTRIIIQLC